MCLVAPESAQHSSCLALVKEICAFGREVQLELEMQVMLIHDEQMPQPAD